MHKCFVTLLLIVSVYPSQPAHAMGFNDFPVETVYAGKNASAPPDAPERQRAALTHPVNFAGHYIVYFYPCGGGCITGSVIDATTGNIVSPIPSATRPPGVYVVDSFKSDFNTHSTLMIITGEDAKKGGGVRRHFYNFANGEFLRLK